MGVLKGLGSAPACHLFSFLGRSTNDHIMSCSSKQSISVIVSYNNNLTISPVTVLMMTVANNDDSSSNRDSMKDNGWQLTFQFWWLRALKGSRLKKYNWDLGSSKLLKLYMNQKCAFWIIDGNHPSTKFTKFEKMLS